MHVGQRNVCFAAIVFDAPRRLRRQAKQRLDRQRCARARAQLQHLAKQGQRHDHRSRLEIHANPAMFAERRREPVGCKRRHQAVAEGAGNADTDQRPHVEVAVSQRLGAANEERPAGPDHHRRAEDQLRPSASLHRQSRAMRGPSIARPSVSKSQRQGPPEATREVAQLRVVFDFQAWHLRLERHPADGTGARPWLADLRMHRAGVDGARRSRFRRGRTRRLQVFRRFGDEAFTATGRAEVELGSIDAARGAVSSAGPPACRRQDRCDRAACGWSAESCLSGERSSWRCARGTLV